MKVCLSSREVIWGGGEVFLRDLGHELLSRGVDVIWRVDERSELASRISGGVLVSRRFRTTYDLLIANDFRSFWQALVLDGFQKKAFVGHGSWQFSPVRVALLQATRTKTFVVSESVAQVAVHKGFRKNPAILPLGPGIWPERPTTDVRRLATTKVDALTFGNVSRLDPIKRLPLFAETVRQLGAKGIIVVPQPESAEELALHDYLESLGHIDLRVGGDVKALWGDIDFFFSTSAAESLGLAHLEALQSGVPVISTAAGGPGDFLIGDLRHGWIPGIDNKSLVAALEGSLRRLQASGDYWKDAQEVLSARSIAGCADALMVAAA